MLIDSPIVFDQYMLESLIGGIFYINFLLDVPESFNNTGHRFI